jgi:hypothetical protein
MSPAQKKGVCPPGGQNRHGLTANWLVCVATWRTADAVNYCGKRDCGWKAGFAFVEYGEESVFGRRCLYGVKGV